MFINLTIYNFKSKYHYSSTMSNRIGRAHKLSKNNRKQPVFTHGPFNKTSTTSHSRYQYIENIDVSSNKSLTTKKYYNKKHL